MNSGIPMNLTERMGKINFPSWPHTKIFYPPEAPRHLSCSFKVWAEGEESSLPVHREESFPLWSLCEAWLQHRASRQSDEDSLSSPSGLHCPTISNTSVNIHIASTTPPAVVLAGGTPSGQAHTPVAPSYHWLPVLPCLATAALKTHLATCLIKSELQKDIRERNKCRSSKKLAGAYPSFPTWPRFSFHS